MIESYYYLIWGSAFFTAVVSGTIGMLGGTLILTVMAQFLAMEVLIPLHGLVQLTSNVSRTWFLRTSINWLIARENILGVVIGSLLGMLYLFKIEESVYNLFLGIFILCITYISKFNAHFQFRYKWGLIGFIASYVGLYVGAVGIFVGAIFLSEKLEKKEMVATQAACQSVVHLSKVLVFMYLGFSLTPWWKLLLGTLVMTSLGSYVGTRILHKVPENIFRTIVKILITLLALNLILTGLRLN